MSSFLRLLALSLFAAAGVGMAVYVATFSDIGSRTAIAELQSAPVADTQPSISLSQPTDAVAEAPCLVPPQQEFAQQVPSDPTLVSPTGQEGQPSLGALSELSKALLEQLNAQQNRAAPRGSQRAPAPSVAEEPEEDETGTEGALEAPQPQQRPPAGSSFNITKLPGEGDDHLSVHIQNKELREVLDFLGEHGGVSILSSNNVQGQVSVSLNDVSIETALAAILKSTGFVARREGQFMYVGTPKDIQGMAQSVDRIGTRVYRPNYVKASELQPLITPLLTLAAAFTKANKVARRFSPAKKFVP